MSGLNELGRRIGNRVAVNETGRRVGEDHPAAKLSDHEVELMRRLHEEYPEGHPQHLGYRKLASKFGVTKTLVRRICNYQLRAQTPAGFKRGT
jgi:hypothetical protein